MYIAYMQKMAALTVVFLTALLGCYMENSVRTKPTIEEQARCADRAEKMAKSFGTANAVTSQSNHYNPTLGLCAVKVSSTQITPPAISEQLVNAYENTRLAAIAEDPVSHQVACSVTLPTGEVKDCRTLSEFEELIKVYMK